MVTKPESKKEKMDKTMCISCGLCRVSGLCMIWKPESEKTDKKMGEIVENQADEP